MDMVIKGCTFNPLTVHISNCKWRRPEYICIHYTAGANSKAGHALSTRKVFVKRQASADFVVDDEMKLQLNPNPHTHYCWAVGDGRGKYGITNSNSISIEICSTLQAGTSASASNHSGWYFTEAALKNATELTRTLMETFGIDKAHVVRHYDASRKNCPGLVGWNDGELHDPKTGKSNGKRNNSDKWKEWHDAL